MSTRLLLGGSAVLAALSLTAFFSAAGCNGVLGLNDFSVGSGAGGNGGDCSSWTPASPACYACAPSSYPQYLNACTSAACVPFDDTRVTNLLPDGGLPTVPPVPDAGFDAPPPVDAAGDVASGGDSGDDGSADDGAGE